MNVHLFPAESSSEGGGGGELLQEDLYMSSCSKRSLIFSFYFECFSLFSQQNASQSEHVFSSFTWYLDTSLACVSSSSSICLFKDSMTFRSDSISEERV